MKLYKSCNKYGYNYKCRYRNKCKDHMFSFLVYKNHLDLVLGILNARSILPFVQLFKFCLNKLSFHKFSAVFYVYRYIFEKIVADFS